MTLRVLVVDDARPARQKVVAHLSDAPDMVVVGEASTGLEAVDLIRRLEPVILKNGERLRLRRRFQHRLLKPDEPG